MKPHTDTVVDHPLPSSGHATAQILAGGDYTKHCRMLFSVPPAPLIYRQNQ